MSSKRKAKPAATRFTIMLRKHFITWDHYIQVLTLTDSAQIIDLGPDYVVALHRGTRALSTLLIACIQPGEMLPYLSGGWYYVGHMDFPGGNRETVGGLIESRKYVFYCDISDSNVNVEDYIMKYLPAIR